MMIYAYSLENYDSLKETITIKHYQQYMICQKWLKSSIDILYAMGFRIYDVLTIYWSICLEITSFYLQLAFFFEICLFLKSY